MFDLGPRGVFVLSLLGLVVLSSICFVVQWIDLAVNSLSVY